jgi:hypothetical protein
MTMKLTQLTTHWDAADVYCVITFLDELPEVLMTAYGDDIGVTLKQTSSRNQHHHTM